VVAQQLDAANLAIQSAEAQRIVPLRAGALDEAQEVLVEDLGAIQRRQRGGVRGPPERQVDGPIGAGAHRDHTVLERDVCLAAVHFQLEREAIPTVEGRLLDTHHPGRGAPAQPQRRLHAAAKLGEARRVEQAELSPLLGGFEPLERSDQLGQFRPREGRSTEGLAVVLLVLEIAFDAHRAEHEPADLERRRLGAQPVLDRVALPRAADHRVVRGPAQPRRLPARVPHGETDALVGGVRPEVHHPPGALVQVDLEGIPACIAEEARAVALVGGRIVETRLGELEHRRDLLRG
jgi:hypothetical protein